MSGVDSHKRGTRGAGTTPYSKSGGHTKAGSQAGPQAPPPPSSSPSTSPTATTAATSTAATVQRRASHPHTRASASNPRIIDVPSAPAPLLYSSAPLATLRSRSSLTLPALHGAAASPTAVMGRSSRASAGLYSPFVDDGTRSGSDDGCEGLSQADMDRERLRRILYGGEEDGAAAVGGLLAHPPTEQDASCDVAAAGIIVTCQSNGVCDLSMRGITRVPPSILKFFRAEGGLVSELQLQGNRLTAVPPLELLPALTRLDLSTNLLTEVPASLGRLRRLRDLDLSRNQQLASLPDALCDLTGLTRLDLSQNALECLPLRVGQLARLVEMRLDGNQLSYLPPSCVGLPSLTALHASHNRLTALPSELGGALSLTGIFLGHNKMTALPATIGNLRQRLAELQLHNNELTVLPREVGRLAALTHITTSGNPLVHPPLAVVRRGVAAVREYLLGGWQGEGGQEPELEPEDSEARDTDLLGDVGNISISGGGAETAAGADGVQRRHGARRLVIGAACKACADKDDRIEELGQLLREARERLERAERQLEHSREQLNRQAKDLAQQASHAVEADAEISRLTRQLAAASLLPGYRGPPPASPSAPAAAGWPSTPVMRQSMPSGGDVEEHLRGELRVARGAAEAAQAAAEEAQREAKKLRRELEERRLQFLAERERAEELMEAVRKERERCNAAVAAATEATHKLERLRPVVSERDELVKKLQEADGVNKDAWQAAHVAREGCLSSEATADVIEGRLKAIKAANKRLVEQMEEDRRGAAAAAAAAEGRERQLQVEIKRLQADLAALMSERDVLQSMASPLKGLGDHATTLHRMPTPPPGPVTLAPARNAWAAPQVI